MRTVNDAGALSSQEMCECTTFDLHKVTPSRDSGRAADAIDIFEDADGNPTAASVE